jgi:hypothetical protein
MVGEGFFPEQEMEGRGKESQAMPQVNIRITRLGATAEQKAALVRVSTRC